MQARTKGGEHNLPIFQPGAQGARSISQKHSLRKDQTGFELISGLGHREAVHQDKSNWSPWTGGRDVGSFSKVH